MVNKDQLDLSPEGKQLLRLLEEHFPGERLQPALTLIEQRYTEDQTVWDADLNREGKLPFTRTTDAHRLLTFFASPGHLEAIKIELAKRAADAASETAAARSNQAAVRIKPQAKARRKPKPKPRQRRATGTKPVKSIARRPQRSKPSPKRPKRKVLPAKAAKPRVKAPKKRKR